MKKLLLAAILCILTICTCRPVLAAAPPVSSQLTADEIVAKKDAAKQPETLTMQMSITLIDKNNNRTSKSVLMAKQGREKTIMWFLTPADEKGSSFLSIASSGTSKMWIYLPGFNKITMVTAKGKRGNFMGTDFTYDDLEGRKSQEYNHKITGTQSLDNKPCWLIEETPKPELKNPPYSKVISYVWQDKFISLKEEYYDKMDSICKVQTILKVETIGDYTIPVKVIMQNMSTEHKTEIDFSNRQINVDLNPGIFTQRYLSIIPGSGSIIRKSPGQTKK